MEQRPWSHLPAPALALLAQRLPTSAIASARGVCKHWQTCCTASAQQLTLKVQPVRQHEDSVHIAPGANLPQPAPQQLLAAALMLPYHALSAAEVSQVVPAASHLLAELASSCPRLKSLDLGFRRHLHYEPVLRKACLSPVLASQISLLPTLVSLHNLSSSQENMCFTDAASSSSGGLEAAASLVAPARPAVRCLQLEHLTLLYCTHSVARVAKSFRAELAQLTSLRSLVINLRGAFTQEEAAALTPLVHLTRLEVHSSTNSFLSARTLQLLSGLACPLQHLLLGPCILNPTPTLLSMFGTLPHLTTLGAWVKCASPVQAFSNDSLAVRCGRHDMSGLRQVSDLRLMLEGYSEARALGTCLGCLSGLRSLELVLRGLWQPGWEHLDQQPHQGGVNNEPATGPWVAALPEGQGWQGEEDGQAGQGGQGPQHQWGGWGVGHGQRQGLAAGSSFARSMSRASSGWEEVGAPCLTRLVVRDERPSNEEEQAMGVVAGPGGDAGAAPAANTSNATEAAGQGILGQAQALELDRGSSSRGGLTSSRPSVTGGPVALFAPLFPLLHQAGGVEPSPLHKLLTLGLVPGLVDLELALAPSMGRCLLDQLPARCPQLRRLAVKGCFQGVGRLAGMGAGAGAETDADLGGAGARAAMPGAGAGADGSRSWGAAASSGGVQVAAAIGGVDPEAGEALADLSLLQCLRELHLVFVPKHTHDKAHLDLACLPAGLRVLELEGCAVVFSQGATASGSASRSPSSSAACSDGGGSSSGNNTPSSSGGTSSDSNSASITNGNTSRPYHSSQLATDSQPSCTALSLLQSLSLRQCSGDAGDCLSHLSHLTSLELRRCYGLSMSLPVASSEGCATARVAAGPLQGAGASAGPPAQCRLPDGWLGLEVLECDSLQRLLGGFQHCCHEIARLRCLSVLSVSLRSPSSMTDEHMVWTSILDALGPGLRTLHLFLDSAAKMRCGGGTGAASGRRPGGPQAEPAVLRVASRLPRLRELKLLGPGGDMTSGTLTRLQRALPYTAIIVEDV